MTETFIEHPVNTVHLLKNCDCVYCGRFLDNDTEITKEHVIGRNFVPRGSLNGEWNLIVNACSACNGLKAKLENDISAITMQPDISGQYAKNDELLINESIRKGRRATSCATGRSVQNSQQKFALNFNSPTLNMSIGAISPPQVDCQRVADLARYHVSAFFFMQTYNGETRKGGWPLGSFCFLTHADNTDWGSDVMRWFMNEVNDWDLRLQVVTAKEYFKLSFRKSNDGLMAWAMEWNNKKRCIGFWGDPDCIDKVLKKKPEPQRHLISDEPDRKVFVRREKPLDADEDTMFSGSFVQ